VGETATTLFILPGALAGACIRLAMWATGAPPSPMLAMITKPAEKKREGVARAKGEAGVAGARSPDRSAGAPAT